MQPTVRLCFQTLSLDSWLSRRLGPCLRSSPLTVMKHSDKTDLKEKGLFWLTVQGYSPSWQEVKATVTRLFTVRKHRVMHADTQLPPHPSQGMLPPTVDASSNLSENKIIPHWHARGISPRWLPSDGQVGNTSHCELRSH